MALDFFGLRCPDRRESVWMFDPSVDWMGTPESGRAAYLRDGEPRHLRLHEDTAPPTRVALRPLTAEERAIIQSRCYRAEGGETRHYGSLELLLAFAVGADLPDVPDPVPGLGAPKYETEDGLRRLSRRLCDWLNATQGEAFWLFFGRLVLAGSRASDADFLASSRVSTGPKSSPTPGTNGSADPAATSAPVAPGSASEPAQTSA